MGSPRDKLYDPHKQQINFPSEIIPLLDTFLNGDGNNATLKSELKAALEDTIPSFSSHFSSPANCSLALEAITKYTGTLVDYPSYFSCTNQLLLILEELKGKDELKIPILLLNFENNFKNKDEQLKSASLRSIADWSKRESEFPLEFQLVKIMLNGVNFPLESKSWEDGLTLLNEGWILQFEDGWKLEAAKEVFKLVPAEFGSGEVKMVLKILEVLMVEGVEAGKLDKFLRAVLAAVQADVDAGSGSKEEEVLAVLSVIVGAIEVSIFSSKSPLPLPYFDQMKDVMPTVALPKFTGTMISYVKNILGNSKDEQYIGSMVEKLSKKDLFSAFSGDVVDSVVDMIKAANFPDSESIYNQLFTGLENCRGKLILTAKTETLLFTSLKEKLEKNEGDKWSTYFYKVATIVALDPGNFVDSIVKGQFCSDFGPLCKPKIEDILEKDVALKQHLFLLFTALFPLGYVIEVADFAKLSQLSDDKFLSKMDKNEAAATQQMLATCAKYLKSKLEPGLIKSLLQNEKLDGDGKLANSILTNIPIPENLWEFILNEIVGKLDEGRKDNVYRALITLAAASKFPRAAINLFSKLPFSPLALQVFLVWLKLKENEGVEPEVEEFIKRGSQFGAFEEKGLEAFIQNGFLSNVIPMFKLFYDLNMALIQRMKEKTFFSEYWFRFLAFQCFTLVAINNGIVYKTFTIEGMKGVDMGSVKSSIQMLLDIPGDGGKKLEIKNLAAFQIALTLLKGTGDKGEKPPLEEISKLEERVKNEWSG